VQPVGREVKDRLLIGGGKASRRIDFEEGKMGFRNFGGGGGEDRRRKVGVKEREKKGGYFGDVKKLIKKKDKNATVHP
jgi:hypothetical protein